MQTQYILCLVACVSALVVFLLRSRAGLVKYIATAVAVGLLVATWAVHWTSGHAFVSIILSALGAVACVLSQRTARDAGASRAAVLFVLGLLFPVFQAGAAAEISECVLLVVLTALSLCFRKNSSLGFGSAAAYLIALTSLVSSLTLHSSWTPVFKLVTGLVTGAALLPLFPLHAGYVGSINNLPGTLPAFLALVLPLVGLYAVQGLPLLPHGLSDVIFCLVVIGAIVTAARTWVQSSLSRVIGGVGTLLLAPAWCLFASSGKLAPEVTAYVFAVALATTGLRLCAHYVEARYGTDALQSVPGLATKMPRFGVSVTLLMMAALGIPALAGFSTAALLLNTSVQLSVQAVLYTSIIWLVCFAIQLSVLHRLLFNQPRPNLIYMDLNHAELMSVAMILLLLIVGGLLPGVMFGLTT